MDAQMLRGAAREEDKTMYFFYQRNPKDL